jgi:hypothetical protein
MRQSAEPCTLNLEPAIIFLDHAEDQSGVKIRHAPRPSLLNFDTSEFEGAHNGQQVLLASSLRILVHCHFIATHDLVPIQ